MNAADEARYVELTKEVRCVVCQNQNIADSSAPLANDLRKKIYTMVEKNKSDNEIKNYLVARYGEFILLKPRFNKLTVLLWLFPFIALLVVGLLLRRYFLNAHLRHRQVLAISLSQSYRDN